MSWDQLNNLMLQLFSIVDLNPVVYSYNYNYAKGIIIIVNLPDHHEKLSLLTVENFESNLQQCLVCLNVQTTCMSDVKIAANNYYKKSLPQHALILIQYM